MGTCIPDRTLEASLHVNFYEYIISQFIQPLTLKKTFYRRPEVTVIQGKPGELEHGIVKSSNHGQDRPEGPCYFSNLLCEHGDWSSRVLLFTWGEAGPEKENS